MANDLTTQQPAADVSIRIGRGVTLDARVSSAGLLSVGALASGILLSTAVLVWTAKRKTSDGAPKLPPPAGG